MNRRCLICLLLFFGCFCGVQSGLGQPDTFATPTAFTKRVPVVPFYDTLFYIHNNVGAFSAEERAAVVVKKIREVRQRIGFQRDSIMVVASGNNVEIVFRDAVIMGVTPADAEVQGKSQLALAQEYGHIISEAIAEHERITDWRYVLLRVSLAVLIVLVLYFLIRLINRLFRRIAKQVEKQKGKKIQSIKLKSFNLLDETRTTQLVISCIRMVQYIAIGLLIYLSLPLVFSVFPPTRGIADKLFGYVVNPVQKILANIVGYIPELITILVIVVVFRYLIRMLRWLAGEIDKGRLTFKGFYPDWAFPTFNIIRILLYALMFVMIWPSLPWNNSPIFQGISVFIGIVFTLGSTSIIGNVVSGLVLTYMRPFKVGDRIKIGDIVGNVIEKTPFVTRIRTPKNEDVTVPNSSIMSAHTFNYTHSAQTHGLILHSKLSLGYDIPWRKIHEMLLEAAKRTPDVLENPPPFILQTALDDFYVQYQLNVYINDADKTPRVYSAMHQNIQDVFNEEGVEIMSPHYQALIHE